MRTLLMFIAASGLTVSAHAQQASPSPAASPSKLPPLPPGPLMKSVPDNTRWTLIIAAKNPPAAKPAESPQPGASASPANSPGANGKAKSSMIGERIGKLAHLINVGITGEKEEKWTDGNLTAILNPGGKEPVYTTTRLEAMPLPSWVSPQNYADQKTEGNKIYLIFRARIIPAKTELFQDLERPDQTDIEALKVDATAVIDADSHLPVAVQEGNTVTTYKFEPLDPGTEIIPPAIRKTLAERGKRLQDLTRKPMRP